MDATVRVRIPVTARSAEAAESEVEDAMVVNALGELSGRGLADALQDRDVVDAEEPHTPTHAIAVASPGPP